MAGRMFLLTTAVIIATVTCASYDYSQYVNLFVGTSYSKNLSDLHDYGQTMPSIGYPRAHTTWTAQTRDNENKCIAPYYHFDDHWRGMRRTHWMSGSCVIDYGSATVLPSRTLDLHQALEDHKLVHDTERATVNQYDVELGESELVVNATGLNTAGVLRISSSRTPSSTTSNDDYFYILFLGSDRMYNQSSVTINERLDEVTVSSPVHRWYQVSPSFSS